MSQVVISDWGTVFVSKFMKDLYDLLQIKANTSTPYHPQTDGQTERVNQEVEKYLQIFVNHLQDDWVKWLSLVAFAHNNHVHSTTSKSPFEVNYGYNANILPGTKPQAPFRTPASTTFVSNIQKIHEETKQALEKAANQMKAQYNKKKWPAVEYQVGDKVWLNTTNLSLPWPKKKLANKRTGPFLIVAKKGASAYTLKLPTNWRIHPCSTNPSWPHIRHPHSLTKNSRLHRHQISLMGKNTMKSKKSSTAENAKSKEKLKNHGTGLQITSSNGKATDQNQTAGYGKPTWTPRNSLTSTSLNT